MHHSKNSNGIHLKQFSSGLAPYQSVAGEKKLLVLDVNVFVKQIGDLLFAWDMGRPIEYFTNFLY